MDVHFAIVSPPRKRGSLNVKLPILIGRTEEAKFRIQQDSVSRRHCEVFIKDGGVYVRDLGSTNGTFLDGEQVTAAVAAFVRPGSEIRVGGVVFRVEYQPTAAVAVADDDTASLGTVPMDRSSSAKALGEAEPLAADAEEEEAAEPGADDRSAHAALGAESLEAEEPADAAGFPMLEPAAEASAESDDDHLNDFFKSLK